MVFVVGWFYHARSMVWLLLNNIPSDVKSGLVYFLE